MIVTCPKCDAEFNLDDSLLDEKGHKVKCSACDEIWFQAPEYVESDIEQEEDLPIDDFDEEENQQKLERRNLKIEEKRRESEHKKHSKNSYLVAAGVFVLVFIYLLASSASIMRKNPKMQAFYSLVGIKMDIIGKGLVFDKVLVNQINGMIKVSGEIINLESTMREVPVIEASLMDSDIKWYITPPENIIKPEGVLSFKSTYSHNINRDLSESNLQIRFIIGAGTAQSKTNNTKTDAANAENTPEPHEGANDHQSDHADPLKSDPHASSASH